MSRNATAGVIISIGLLLGIPHASGQQSDHASGDKQCFSVKNLVTWRAPNPSTINVRFNPRRYFRLDLEHACPALQWPGSRLIINSNGEAICSAIGWDIRISDSTGSVTQQCVVRSMTPLSESDLVHIPKSARP
jgi:hypothetical protein